MQKKSRTNWEKIRTMGDEEIDFSEIPETDDEFWKGAKIVLPTEKQRISIFVDKNVLQWFKKRGKGYQTKINAVLKSYVEAHS